MNADTLDFVLEILGTIAFAITGVITAAEKKMDILGATILGLTTAVGGGMLRDIMLGYLPPAVFRNVFYSVTAVITSAAVFVIVYFAGTKIAPHMDTYQAVINIFDSIGLAIFTVGGVQRAHSLGFGSATYLCIFVGVLTGVGGGMLRDIMAGKIPGILTKRVYALAAIIGAVIFQYAYEYELAGSTVLIFASAAVILAIRILATIFRWDLPRIEKDLFPGKKKKHRKDKEENN